mgnify:CR=1 FL=1
MVGNQSVSGLTQEQIESIRKLKAELQADNPQLDLSNRDAVMWAVNNCLETQ